MLFFVKLYFYVVCTKIGLLLNLMQLKNTAEQLLGTIISQICHRGGPYSGSWILLGAKLRKNCWLTMNWCLWEYLADTSMDSSVVPLYSTPAAIHVPQNNINVMDPAVLYILWYRVLGSHVAWSCVSCNSTIYNAQKILNLKYLSPPQKKTILNLKWLEPEI